MVMTKKKQNHIFWMKLQIFYDKWTSNAQYNKNRYNVGTEYHILEMNSECIHRQVIEKQKIIRKSNRNDEKWI